MYSRILAALDGSEPSNLAAAAALHLSQYNQNASLIGCHVYAAAMHYTRFGEMEPGLPARYQQEERLGHLRHTHDGLITEGMQIISDAYLDPIAEKARIQGIPWEGVTPEGRNYVEFLRVIDQKKPDIVVLGACGHGSVPESGLGSLAERALLYAHATDLLLIRRPWDFQGRPIVVGIDGSPASFSALHRALEIAAIEQARVDLLAVFDPYFHSGVFRTLAGALPEDKKKRFNFEAQEKLHDEIIDRGLEQLYEEKLLQGKAMAEERGVHVRTQVLKGKVFPQLHQYAEQEEAALLVVGRWGLHRESISLVGSHTLNLARICHTNLLVVTPSEDGIVTAVVPGSQMIVSWTPEAEEMMGKVPAFARGMARKAVERYGQEAGLSEIDTAVVQEVAGRFGMRIGSTAPATVTPQQPVADRVVLRKVRRFAPDCHRHIVKSRITGQTLQKGDRVLVYEVEETQPAGKVRVTDHTSLEFR
jgi:nucleotide-binding universal stress UspA family protein